MKSTFSILFFIDRSKANEEGLCLIRCRISCNGKISSFSTKQQTAPEDWNAQRARVKTSSPTAQGINNALYAIEQGLNALYERISPRGAIHHSRVPQRAVSPHGKTPAVNPRAISNALRSEEIV